ncbi:MAG: lipid A biosynthesis protein [Planctomycetes bacterium]|nr:lipid A biosynthesis protein [Planctomycetota bacterium]
MFHSVIEFFRTAISEQIVGDPIWATVALVGQFIFGGRFVLQWLVSEYRKKSHVPIAFWYLSILGSLILLAYSVHIKNPIFMLSFSLNTLIYVRNLHLLYLESRRITQL